MSNFPDSRIYRDIQTLETCVQTVATLEFDCEQGTVEFANAFIKKNFYAIFFNITGQSLCSYFSSYLTAFHYTVINIRPSINEQLNNLVYETTNNFVYENSAERER